MGIKRTPYYFNKFRCIGGGCEDNCCIGWEVDIDDDAFEVYNSADGDFGERLRSSMSEENSFMLKNNRCPFLNDENLCDIFINLGEENLCTVCTEYPRFTEFFGELTEVGIGLSCETAAELILGSDEKTYFVTEETDDIGEIDFEEDFLEELIGIREDIFEILQNRDIPLSDRIKKMFVYAENVQDRLNNNGMENVEKKEICKSEKSIKNLENCVAMCLDLEILADNWIDTVHEVIDIFDDAYFENCTEFESYIKDREYEYEHILVYFIFRYLLKATFDYDVLTKVKFAVVSYIIIKQMDIARWIKNGKEFTFRDRIKNAVLYSKEVEHCQDNVDFFSEEFIFNEVFEREKFMGMI